MGVTVPRKTSPASVGSGDPECFVKLKKPIALGARNQEDSPRSHLLWGSRAS